MATARAGNRIPPEAQRILFVKNLSFKLTTEDMYEIFGKYGPVRQIRMGSDSKTKGTAFVVYEDLGDARRALQELNGFHLMDRYLVVLQHQPEKQLEKAAELAAREEELARLKERHEIE